MTKGLLADVLLGALGQPVPAGSAAEAQLRPGPDTLVEFRQRVDGYAALRQEVTKTTPPMVPTTDVAHILSRRARLVQRLKSARGEARKGDIFAPGISAEFRRLLLLELTGPNGKEALVRMGEAAPAAFALSVNASYPEGEPMGAMSPGVLRRLPPLPASLQYRFVGPHLVLLDVAANLIVDFITDAIWVDPSASSHLAPRP
mgnify:CR=1 FL=1